MNNYNFIKTTLSKSRTEILTNYNFIMNKNGEILNLKYNEKNVHMYLYGPVPSGCVSV